MDNDYTVFELFEQLKTDESWEADPFMRFMTAMTLYINL